MFCKGDELGSRRSDLGRGFVDSARRCRRQDAAQEKTLKEVEKGVNRVSLGAWCAWWASTREAPSLSRIPGRAELGGPFHDLLLNN